MKKILFILLTIILLMPTVSAETVQMTPNLNYWEQDVQTFSNKTLYGGKYWGVYTGFEQYFTTARFVFDYRFPVQGDVYNVYFWMVAEGLTPIFSLNDIPCTVVPSYYNQNGVNTGLNMVACIDIPYSNKFEVVLKGSWPGTSNGEHFGINNTVTINRFSTSDTALQQGVDNINNQMAQNNQIVQDTNDKIGDLNENITSSDVTESKNQASSFFDGFDVTDNGGISSIVTSPLVAIEKMVSGTCSPLTATYKGKTITLPCGNSFWADMPDVQNFLNIILGGFLCYGILAKLYLLIDRLKNPEDDRVEVMKL